MLKAFHGDLKIKNKYLKRVIAHQKADNLVRGEGWNGQRGCAVGCTLEAYDHKRYESELGIPEWLAKVEDTLFEGMSEKKSRTWPEKFLKAIKPGVNLEKIKAQFCIVVLKHSLISMNSCKYDEKLFPQVKSVLLVSKAAVEQMIKAQKVGDSTAISAANSTANSATESAYSAAESAYSAANSAYSAARSAAYDYYAKELLKLLKKAK